jgi:hypothetical protein
LWQWQKDGQDNRRAPLLLLLLLLLLRVVPSER